MTETRSAPRAAGPTAAGGAACASGAILYLVALSAQVADPGAAWPLLLAGAGSVLLAAGPVALDRSGAAGAGVAARAGLAAASLGWLVTAVANVVAGTVRSDPVAVYVVGTALLFAGMLAAGVAVLRARRWSGWRRATPLLCALWLLAVGWLFGDDGPSGALAVGSWLLTWAALGVALASGRQR